MRHFLTIAFFISAHAFAQNTCLDFPAGLIPLSSIAYVTAANSAGDRLVVGALANGMNTLAQLPGPTGTNQLFCESPIQLAAIHPCCLGLRLRCRIALRVESR